MPSKNTLDLILLSKLIEVLKDNEYYRTYAKSLALTENTNKPLPSDDDLIKEMFHYFIATNELKIYYKGSNVSHDFIKSEAQQRALKNTNSTAESELQQIWKNEIYVNIQDLKKLYANKCIVFPSSLLRDLTK